MTNYRSTVSLEVHRGPITKGCGMTETPIDQAVCQHCGHSSTMLPSDHERLDTYNYGTMHADVRHTRTDDTRTRAQLDDGCVTGCNCNGTSPKG